MTTSDIKEYLLSRGVVKDVASDKVLTGLILDLVNEKSSNAIIFDKIKFEYSCEGELEITSDYGDDIEIHVMSKSSMIRLRNWLNIYCP